MLDGASTKLADAKSEWVRRVLGVSVPLPVTQQKGTADLAMEAVSADIPPPPAVPANAQGQGKRVKARLAAMLPRLKALEARRLPGARDVKLKLSEAGTLARGGNFDAANTLLDEAEQLTGKAAEAPAPTAPLVRLQRARLTWGATRATVRQSLRTLEFEMLKFFEGRAEMATAQDAVRRFDEVLEELDDDLIDTLDEALNEQDPVRRQDVQAEARACIEDYEHFVQSSNLVAAIDGNPFTRVGLREMVLRSAAQLHAALG